MYGDPQVLFDKARYLQTVATEIDHAAAALVSRAASTHWVGLAAKTREADVTAAANALRAVAQRIEVAAEAMNAFATSVEKTIAEIARAEQAVIAWFHSAEATFANSFSTTVHDAAHVAGTAWNLVSGSANAPPPWFGWPWNPSSLPESGSKDWLDLADLVTKSGF